MVDDRGLDPVRQLPGDDVPALDAEVRQHAGASRDRIREAAERQAPLPLNQRVTVRLGSRRVDDAPVDQAALPEPLLAVAAAKRRRSGRDDAGPRVRSHRHAPLRAGAAVRAQPELTPLSFPRRSSARADWAWPAAR